MQSSPKKRKEKHKRDVRMDDAIEKCEDDQNNEENCPPRKS